MGSLDPPSGENLTAQELAPAPDPILSIASELELDKVAQSAEDTTDKLARLHSKRQSLQRRFMSMGVVAAALIAVATIALHGPTQKPVPLEVQEAVADQQFKTQTTSLPNLSNRLQSSAPTSGAHTLQINGQLGVNGSIVLKPMPNPGGATAGEIYYDNTRNQLAYYDGSHFIYLPTQVTNATSVGGATGIITLGAGLIQNSGALSNTGVLAIGGQNGDILLGNGLSISGGKLHNTGVISLRSDTPGLTITNNGNGNYILTDNTGAAGGGTVSSPGGTSGHIAEFTGSQTIANSILIQSGNTITVAGTLNATTLAGNGQNVTNLNAGNLASGTIANARLSGSVTIQGNSFNNAGELVQLNATGGLPALDGFLLTNLNANSIATGTLSDARLSSNVALLNGNNNFTGTLQHNGDAVCDASNNCGYLSSGSASGQFVQLQSSTPGTAQGGNFNIDGAGIANELDATTVKQSGNVVCDTSGNCPTGGNVSTSGTPTSGTIAMFAGGATIGDSIITQAGATISVAGTLSATTLQGDGSGVTNVDAVTLQGNGASYFTDASNISGGTLADGRLSGNVTLKGNTFNGALELVQLNATAGLPALDGSLLTSLDAANVASGTLSDARLSTNVALLDAGDDFTNTLQHNGNNVCDSSNNCGYLTGSSASGQFVQLQSSTPGTAQAGNFNIDGAGIANELDATTIKQNGNGVCDISGNCAGTGGGVTTTGGTNGTIAMFTGGQTIGDSILTQSGTTISVAGTLSATSLQGDGSGVTNIDAVTLQGNSASYFTDAGNISTGTLADGRLSSNVTLGGNTFNGALELVQLNATAGLPALDGSLLTNLNASNIASGTLADGRLSANVTLKGNTFNGNNQLVLLNGTGGLPALDGSLLTNLNASNIASGTLNDGRLSTNVALLNADNNFTGTSLQHNGNAICDNSNNCSDVTTSTAAGGDLSGTYPNPTIAKLQGSALTITSPAAGQVLNYNGSAWVNTGSPTISGLLTVQAGATISGGALALTGNTASTLKTTSGALTLTSAAAATWSTSAGDLTLQAGSGTVSLGTSTALTASGALAISAGGTGSLSLDTSNSSASVVIGGTHAGTIQLGATTGTATQNVNVGTNGTAGSTTNVTIGSGVGSSTTTVQGSTGGVWINTGSTTGTTGSIVIQSGNSSGGTSGNISIDNGNGALDNGTSVMNDDFEGCSVDNMAFWFNTSSIAAINYGSAHGGSCVLAVAEDSGDGGFWGVTQDAGQPFSVTPGQQYSFSAWVRADSLAQSISGTVVWVGGSGSVNLSTATDTTTGWTRITGQAVAPAGATGGFFEFGNGGDGNGSSTTYFDDITVTANAGAPTVDIGTSNAQSVNIGNLNQTWGTSILSGSGGINLSTGGSIKLSSGGNVLVTPSVDSAVAFQVQDAGGNGILTVDTSANILTVAKSSNGGELINNGSTLNTAKNLGNFAASGSLGSAASTVDVYTTFVIPQTTGSVTLTLPSPTNTTAGRIIYILNTGSATLTVAGITLNAGSNTSLLWNGSSWTSTAVSTGVSLVGTFSGSSQVNGASISGNTITFGPADGTNPGMVTTGTQTLAGAKTFSSLLTGTAGATINGGALSLTGNAASSLTTSTGALTLTSAVAATWSTSAGSLTLQAGNGTVSLGSSTALTASGALAISTGGTGSLNLDTSNSSASVIIGGTHAGTIQLGSTASAVTQSINIGTNATSGSVTNVAIGSTIGGSATTIKGGTGGISIADNTGTISIGNSASTQPLILQGSGITQTITGDSVQPSDVIQSTTNSTSAFQVQNAGGTSMFNVNTNNALINDNMTTTAPSGTLVNNASWVSGQYVELDHGTPSIDGEVNYIEPGVGNSFDAKFSFWSATGGGDGTWLYAYDTIVPTSYHFGTANGGYDFAYSDTNSDVEVYYNGTLLASAPISAPNNSTWHTAEVTKSGNKLTMYYDGSAVLTYTDGTARSLTGTNFGLGGCSCSTSGEHRAKTFTFTSDMTTTDAYSQFNTGINVSGQVTATIVVAPKVQTSSIDTSSSGSLTLGAVNATSIIIGGGSTPSASPKLLVLASGSSSSDPTGVDGAIYYNSNLGEFRCHQGGTWIDCIGFDAPDSQRQQPLYSNDFLNYSSPYPWIADQISFLGTQTMSAGTANHPGVLTLGESASCTSSAGGPCGWAYNVLGPNDTNAPVQLNGGESFEFVFRLDYLSATTTTYFGFLNGLTGVGLPSNGAYFSIANTTLAGNADKSGSAAFTASHFTVSTGTWYRGRVVMNSNATQATFSLYNDSTGGGLVWSDTVSTDIPTAATGDGFETYDTSSPSSAKSLIDADYMSMYYTGTSLNR